MIPVGSNFCTANLIDEGTVVNENSVTVYFRGVGPVTQFLCSFDCQRKFTCEFLCPLMVSNDHLIDFITLFCTNFPEHLLL